MTDVTQSSFHNYFGGSEIVVAGKVDTENLQHLESIVTATAVSEGVPRLLGFGLVHSLVSAVSLLELIASRVFCLLGFWVEACGNSWGGLPDNFTIPSSNSHD